MGVAFAPKVEKVSRKMLFCITRTFIPWKSSQLVMGRCEFDMLRKPFSQ